MRRFASSVAILALCSASLYAGDGNGTVQVENGKDLLPPVVTQISNSCGVVTLEATEIRNNPNPPRPIPEANDQIEKGLAGVRFLPTPAATNVEFAPTPGPFPQNPALTRSNIVVRLRDASKAGFALVETRDWAGNADTITVNISPLLPAFVTTTNDAGIVATGTTKTMTVKVSNPGNTPLTISSLTLKDGTVFAISGVTLPVTIPGGGTIDVTVTYSPTGTTIVDNRDSIFASSDCPGIRVGAAVSGTVGVAIIGSGADWDAGTAKVGQTKCKDDGITITNTGNVELRVDRIDITGPYTYAPGNPGTPFTVAPGASQVVTQFCFVPTANGSATGSATFVSNKSTGDEVVNFTGNGDTTSVDEDINVEGFNAWFSTTNGTLNVSTGKANGTVGVVTVTDVQGRVLFSLNSTLEQTVVIPAQSWVRGVVVVSLQTPAGVRSMLVAVKG